MEINLNSKSSLDAGVIDIIEQVLLNEKNKRTNNVYSIKSQNLNRALAWIENNRKNIFQMDLRETYSYLIENTKDSENKEDSWSEILWGLRKDDKISQETFDDIENPYRK